MCGLSPFLMLMLSWSITRSGRVLQMYIYLFMFTFTYASWFFVPERENIGYVSVFANSNLWEYDTSPCLDWGCGYWGAST